MSKFSAFFILTWSTKQLSFLYCMEKCINNSKPSQQVKQSLQTLYDSWNQPHIHQLSAPRFWSPNSWQYQTISISSHGHGTSAATFRTGSVLWFVAVDAYGAPMVVVPSLTAAAPGGRDAHGAHGDGGDFVARVVGIGRERWQPAGRTFGRGLWSSISGCNLDAFNHGWNLWIVLFRLFGLIMYRCHSCFIFWGNFMEAPHHRLPVCT